MIVCRGNSRIKIRDPSQELFFCESVFIDEIKMCSNLKKSKIFPVSPRGACNLELAVMRSHVTATAWKQLGQLLINGQGQVLRLERKRAFCPLLPPFIFIFFGCVDARGSRHLVKAGKEGSGGPTM